MEFLTNLFGNLASGVIRLAVTVGILAAVYFFIVKPVLHTTEHTVDTANEAFQSPSTARPSTPKRSKTKSTNRSKT